MKSGGFMERERPEYLPPIEKPRWSFPWLTVIGVSVLALAVFGIKQHLATQAAWNQRFAQPRPSIAKDVIIADARRNAELEAREAEIRLRRHVEMQRAREQYEQDRKTWRCINNVPFRQIPGGWENVPGESC